MSEKPVEKAKISGYDVEISIECPYCGNKIWPTLGYNPTDISKGFECPKCGAKICLVARKPKKEQSTFSQILEAKAWLSALPS